MCGDLILHGKLLGISYRNYSSSTDSSAGISDTADILLILHIFLLRFVSFCNFSVFLIIIY